MRDMVKKHKGFLLYTLAGVLILSVLGCKGGSSRGIGTLSPAELAAVKAKATYQRLTQEAIQQLTRPSGVGEEKTEEVEQTLPLEVHSTPTPGEQPPSEGTLYPSSTSNWILDTPSPTSILQELTNTATPRPGDVVRTSTPTSTKTFTATPTSTIIPQTGWGGTWTGYLQQPNGSYQSGTLNVTLNGNQVDGVFLIGGASMTLTGEVTSNDLQVSGTYSDPGGTGLFLWRMFDMSQIRGNLDNLSGFCATREGGTQPDPCGYFLPN